MARHYFVGLAADTGLLQHGTAGSGAWPLVAPLSAVVPPARQQLVTGSTTGRSFLITGQPLILHLLTLASVCCELSMQSMQVKCLLGAQCLEVKKEH